MYLFDLILKVVNILLNSYIISLIRFTIIMYNGTIIVLYNLVASKIVNVCGWFQVFHNEVTIFDRVLPFQKFKILAAATIYSNIFFYLLKFTFRNVHK